MSNSNDIKWNKIQEIMEELSFPGIVITSPLRCKYIKVGVVI